MNESVRIVVEERSQTAEARRVSRSLAVEVGFDEAAAEQVAIVVTEACTNLLKHAGRGEILLTIIAAKNAGEARGLELLALDRGPGMADLNRCLRDGFSTAGSPGEGMGAIIRLSGTSDFYSVPEKGSAVMARWAAGPPNSNAPIPLNGLSVGAINLPKPGENVCGDSWAAYQTKDVTVILVADGLGHGVDAHIASLEAVRMLHSHADLPPKMLTERVHQALRSTRGAAVAIARIDHARQVLQFAGVGNISAQINSGGKASQHLVSAYGTAGHQANGVREFSYPWPADGVLLMYSDGLSTSTGLNSQPGLAQRDPSLIAGVLYRDFSRGNDDSTVVVAKAA